MAFTALTPEQTVADSPVDQTLMDLIRTNLDDLDAARVTNGDSHDHSAGDGDPIPQGGLATSMPAAESTIAGFWDSRVMPGGEYGFFVQIKVPTGTFGSWQIAENLAYTTGFTTRIAFKRESGSGTIYMQQRYVTASPPYKIGGKTWGYFLWLLRNISTGVVVGASFAEDPVWAHNGLLYLPKDHPDRITAVPYPFANYFDKDPATDGLEIVLVDLSGIDVPKWVDDNWKVGKCVLEDLGAVLTGKGTAKTWNDYTVPTIPKFTDKVKVITP